MSTMKKPRAVKTPEEIAAIKECRARTSFLGARFPKSFPFEWDDYQALGWVHSTEILKIRESYRECKYSGHWDKIENMKEDLLGHWIRASLVGEYVICPISQAWCRADLMVEVTDDGETFFKVSKETASTHYRECSYTGKVFHRGIMVKVLDSQYNWLCKASAKAIASQCPMCEKYYEKPKVKARVGLTCHACDHCFEEKTFGHVIFPHDFDSYPKPVISKAERLGHRVKDGMIFATNEPEPVKFRRMFGVEVELELHRKGLEALGLKRHHIAVEAMKALGNDFIIIKEDGTLTLNGHYGTTESGICYAGFEIVTAPADLATHRERWPRIKDMPNFKQLRAWDVETCGNHVHVSRSSLTSLQLGRMLVFINHDKNKGFIQLVAGRSERKFTRYIPKEPTDVLHPERVSSPGENKERDRRRRVALNICNPNTVEFRIFRGTINPRHIVRNIEFCDAVCDFCCPCSRSMMEFHSPEFFIAFIGENRKKWPRLSEWMVLHKLLVVKPPGKGAKPELFTLNPDTVEEGEDKRDEANPPKLEEVVIFESDIDDGDTLSTFSGQPIFKVSPKKKKLYAVDKIAWGLEDHVANCGPYPDPFITLKQAVKIQVMAEKPLPPWMLNPEFAPKKEIIKKDLAP